MPYFSDINFRYTDSRSEKLYSPEVLRDAFVDVRSCIAQIIRQDKYIIHGSKGSGKTALASYYELKAREDEMLFSRVDDLEDFDYSLLSSDGGTNASTHVPRTIGAWKFLLSLRLFALLSEDEGLCQRNSALVQLKQELGNRGLLPSPNLTKLANSTFGLDAELGFNFIGNFKAKGGRSRSYTLKSPSQIAEGLLSLFRELEIAGGRYFLFVDGLDHVLRGGAENLYAIGDLINAVRNINELLQSTSLDAKIILLLRSEVARAIPNPDLSKRLTDNGVLMEWFYNARSPLSSDLMRVIQNRARLAGFAGTIGGFWWLWMPDTIGSLDSARYILARTRFLPRDIIRFFYYLQKIGNIPFKVSDVLAAEKEYSQWFFDELYDSLAGLVDERVRSSLGGILAELGTTFKVKDLHASLERRDLASLISGDELARLLFETHWVGNMRTDADSRNYNVYKSRSRSAGFSSDFPCVLSAGLIKGLNAVSRTERQRNRSSRNTT